VYPPMANLVHPVKNASIPLDGKSYHFARYSVSSTPVDLLAEASAYFGDKQIVTVEVEVVTDSSIRVSLNNMPNNPSLGRTITSQLPWGARCKVDSLVGVHTADTDPASVEVECYVGE